MNRKDLDPSKSPAAAFGAELRRLREERGWTQQHVARLTQYSSVHVSAVETGRKSPTEKFARRLDHAFDIPGHFEREWRKGRGSVLLDGLREYLRNEETADKIDLFEINIIPGLLQTRPYAQAYQNARVRRGRATQEQADARTTLLMKRQARLTEAGPRIHAVIDEGCLRRTIGGPAVMREQLLHLESLATHPQVIIQVSPFALGEDRPFGHPVTLLTMPTGTLLGYGETQRRGFLERDSATLTVWAGEYDELQVEALSKASSLEFIRHVRRGIENG
ncbi:helix-turn-helix transcriptional regulator [Kitasatospora sp. NPDC001527]|uniref:helix-turn-helix domain-containing protein n=1 Tax=Kitasatospora sp. NPDC001527 TaxID=3154519 RepID=UPI00332FD345